MAAARGVAYAAQADAPHARKTAQAGGHFYLPALIAHAAGISNERLARILSYSQFPDQVSPLDGYTNGTRSLASSKHYAPGKMGEFSEKALHALNGRTVKENLEFYQYIIAKYKDNDAVVGIALHGLVDAIFHSHKVGNEMRTYVAPLGHGAHGSEPDYVSPQQVHAATGEIITAFETLAGKPLSPEQRNLVNTQVDDALSRAAQRTQGEVDTLERMRETYGEAPRIDPHERMELHFRDVVKELVPDIPGVTLKDLPSPFFRAPITAESTQREGRIFFGHLPQKEADKLTTQGLDGAVIIEKAYKEFFKDASAPEHITPEAHNDTKVWSLRRVLPWLNDMPAAVPPAAPSANKPTI